MANSYLDKNGLLYVWQKIKEKFVAKETGKGLSTNDYTTTDKNKLGSLPGIKQIGSGLELTEQGVLNATGGGTVDSVSWENVTGKPDTFPPATHNHDGEYLKLSGGQMTGPIQFSSDQGGFEVQGSNVETKVQMTETGTEILFDDNQNNLRNRVTVFNTGVAMVAGATLADGEETPGTGVTVTIDKDNGVKIPMVATPTADRDAANKKYVDDKAATKADKATTLAGYGITDAYTKSELDGKLSSVYKPAGNTLFANLPEPSASNLGNVYSMMDAFTTDDRFVASEPTQYPIGTNVAVVQVMVEDAPTYLFDVLAGFVDLSGYLKKTDMVAIANEEIDQIVGDSAA